MAIISDSPKWFDLGDDVKEYAIEQDFNKKVAGREDFQSMDPGRQEELRFGHRQEVERVALESQHNPSNIRAAENQAEADRSGFMGNLGQKLVTSHLDAVARGGFAADLIGDVEIDAGARMSKYLQKRAEAPVTREAKKLGAAIDKWDKATDQSGFMGDVAATAEALFIDLPQNLGGVMDVAAESAASMTTHGMGAWAGAKIGGAAGSVIPGAGTAAGATVGAIAGMVAAGTIDAGTAKYAERIQGRLEEFDLAPTPKNIALVLSNKEWLKETQTASLKYGGMLGIVDAAFGGFATKLAALPAKAARKEAAKYAASVAGKTRIAKIALDTGESIADVKTAMLKSAVSKTSVKVKTKATSYVGEVAGEPASEAAATASIGEEVKAKDLIYETLGGIGAGPYGAAINVAVFGSKAGTGKAKKTIKAIAASTPEGRAKSKEAKTVAKESVKAAKAQRDAPADFGYKKELAETSIDDTATIDAWADPKSESYSPHKAVEKLAESDKQSDVQRAKDIEVDLYHTKLANVERRDKLLETLVAAGEKADPAMLIEAQGLTDTIAIQNESYQRVQKKSEELRRRLDAFAAEKDVKPVDPEVATDEAVVDNIIGTLGSHGHKDATTDEQLDTLLAKDDISEENRTLLEAKKLANTARRDVEKSSIGSSKTMSDVTTDVYFGGRDSKFRGADSYNQAIGYALEAGDVATAKKEFGLLSDFRDAHQLKADNFKELYDVVRAKGLEGLTPTQEATYATMQRENPKLVIAPHSGTLVNAIEREAWGLQKEVAVAEALFKAKEAKTEPTTQPGPEEKPEPTSAKPAAKVEPVVEVKEAKAPEQVKEKPSTEAAEADTVTDNLKAYDKPKDEIDVVVKDTEGKEQSVPYSEALAEVETEIEEYKRVLECCKKL